MMGGVTGPWRTGPDEWECHVLIAVAEERGTTRAAQRLRRLRGGKYERQSVEKTIRKVEDWAGEQLFRRDSSTRQMYPTERGRQVVAVARRVVTEYRLMRQRTARESPPVLACLAHHAHFVSIAEDILFERRGAGAPAEPVRVEYLEDRHRGEGEFHQYAVNRLHDGDYQLIIGPPVADAGLASTPLYRARLEAMVGVAHEDRISLTELVTGHRLLVPPPEMRSRRLLEESIQRWGVPDPGPDVRVAAETHETATSVMRVRSEHRRRGTGDSRVVVVSSDVALAFKQGMEFGGRHAERFKWVPIYHRTDDDRYHLLEMQVCATTRRGERADLTGVIAALRAAVDRLNSDPGHDGLSGAPFHPPPAIPRQRDRIG